MKTLRKLKLTALAGLFLIFPGGVKPASAQQSANNEYQTGAVLWMQASGERAALCYQAFALARLMLDR
ncbi:MAG TPA: hypothetical protein VKD91_13895, partial [Pyrinomonadaceae bacterium]|nr:hypothetical protein [Pyrinomonadaceae bacterium]